MSTERKTEPELVSNTMMVWVTAGSFMFIGLCILAGFWFGNAFPLPNRTEAFSDYVLTHVGPGTNTDAAVLTEPSDEFVDILNGYYDQDSVCQDWTPAIKETGRGLVYYTENMSCYVALNGNSENVTMTISARKYPANKYETIDNPVTTVHYVRVDGGYQLAP